MALDKKYSINFTEEQKKSCLSLYYNGVNRYRFANKLQIYKLKAKDSEVNADPKYLGNDSKDIWVDNMKK